MEENTRKEPVPTGAGSPFFMCRQQALRYLCLREHNRCELKTKLLGKGYDVALVDSVLDDLVDDGSLSERRYVESFVRSSNRRHPEGKSLVLARLAAKGADRLVCSEVLDEMYGDYDHVSSLVRQAYSRIVSKAASKGKSLSSYELRQALAKLGFSSVQVRECLEHEDSSKG